MRVLLAGPDTLYFSCDLPLSEAMRDRLNEEKATAQTLADERRVHCPEWLGARVCPQGAKGGYAFLIETEDFSVKLLGERIQNRPSVFIEMRSYALHTHPEGPQGACRRGAGVGAGEAVCRSTVQAGRMTPFPLRRPSSHERMCTSTTRVAMRRVLPMSRTSCAASSVQARRRARSTSRGVVPLAMPFGKGHVQARLYNKTLETKEKANDSYAALLLAKNGEAYDPEQDVWRLEFQLRAGGGEGVQALCATGGRGSDEAEIEAELAAEELQHIGTLPRFFARMNELVLFLTQHWLRLVEDNGSANRSRWPTHPTWIALREQFGAARAGAAARR